MTHSSISVATPSAPIECATAAQRLWDYLDHELDDVRAAEVQSHLAVCQQCPSHFELATALQGMLRTARAGGEDPRALQQRVVAALSAAGFSPGPT